jgi:signal transduction histidine kinase
MQLNSTLLETEKIKKSEPIIEITDLVSHDWIEGESIRAFMPLQLQTQTIALLIIPCIFALLFSHVYTLGLIVWTVSAFMISIYRWFITKHYLVHLAEANSVIQLRFMKRYGWTWPVAAALWGALVWLFFTEAPLLNQFIIWSILASIGVFSMTGYSPHLKTLKIFINTMVIVILSGVAWHYFTTSDANTSLMTHWLLPFIFLLWGLLVITGSRLNNSHIQGLKLRRGNEDLIASLKEETRRANQAVETKNRFLASAAHDIRQPVLALDVYASMLRAEPELAGMLTEKIEIATKSVIEMFDSLFDLSRLDAGQLHINKTTIDVFSLMSQLELQYMPVAHAKKLTLRIRKSKYKIHTDEQLLKRIIGNLLMNAVKFTDKGGILLACRPALNGIRFEVWDTGVGIAADEQTAVFGEFYKSPSHLGTSEGFGLGLSIVSRLCEALGFNFSMRSRLGRGSVFYVEVPTVAS